MRISQRVKDTAYGHTGVIGQRFDNFKATGHKQWWLEAQDVPFSAESLSERWYQVLCDDGGAILAPESRLDVGDQTEALAIWQESIRGRRKS